MNRLAVAYTLVAAAANIVGAAAVAWRSRWSVPALEKLIALSAGFMVSVAILDLAPEAIVQHGAGAAPLILVGFLLVHLTQHTLVPHFHFGEEVHEVTRAVSMSALAGLLLHTFVDGVAIASGFEVRATLGFLVFTAILLHKLPEGLAISSIFLASGSSRRRAMLAGTSLGIATIVGGVMTSLIAPLRNYGLAFAAGVSLYVGASNLVPEFQSKRDWKLQGSFFLGCLLYFVARILIGLYL
ncbi:MAG TPA: ZIP family metal transporter [Gemmatimonadaceae bacterium]|nr:ZIP family metal transporter [Gemmatimonadaceae bacterium]